jgi:hypothetical protein
MDVSTGWPGWANQHLHKPDKEAVTTDQGDGQKGKKADDKKQEKAGFLAFLHIVGVVVGGHRG